MDLVDGPKERDILVQRKTFASLSIQKARFSSAVRCSITAKTCKKAALKSRIPTLWLTAPAAKVSQFSKPAQLIGVLPGSVAIPPTTPS